MKNRISNMIGNRTGCAFRILFTACLIGMLLNVKADVKATHAKMESPAVLDSVTLLKSAKTNDEKLKYLEELHYLYMDNALLIQNKLRYDIANHLKDGGYCSPLHLSLRAVSCWHVRSAMDDLLKIIDYKLDPQTIPLGGVMLEDYLHPVLRVLINLGIESRISHRPDTLTSQVEVSVVIAHRSGEKLSVNRIYVAALRRNGFRPD